MRKILLFIRALFHFSGRYFTYLQHAIGAHLAAGHDVHLLTWLTSFPDKYNIDITDELVAPLDRSRVTVLRFSLRRSGA
jgi:hypothetical protein